ncbi:glutamyl-tRNA synthetase [Metarhizium rileyi]|uniref:Glutamyl-tRNA synthetase n=1 Tax=Metarhizium rileyi (strain RCEF 4871) TaxID=1649241 RepID=A0A162K1G6_METRR|nr:glutamyl-tRNA synthetase [Metarhizium rileyi RCEF 4871]
MAFSRLSPAHAQALRIIDEAHCDDPSMVDGPDGPKTVPSLASSPACLQGPAFPAHFVFTLLKIELNLDTNGAKGEALPEKNRWELPRSEFPMTRPGYLTWRAKQKSQAASRVSALLSSPTIQPPLSHEERGRVAALVRKEALSTDAETQVLEDVACLVFLDDRFDDFEARPDMDEEKMVGIE